MTPRYVDPTGASIIAIVSMERVVGAPGLDVVFQPRLKSRGGLGGLERPRVGAKRAPLRRRRAVDADCSHRRGAGLAALGLSKGSLDLPATGAVVSIGATSRVREFFAGPHSPRGRGVVVASARQFGRSVPHSGQRAPRCDPTFAYPHDQQAPARRRRDMPRRRCHSRTLGTHNSTAGGQSGTENTREVTPPDVVYQPSDPTRHSRQSEKYHTGPTARSSSAETGRKIHSLLDVAGLSAAVPWGTTAEMNSSANHNTLASATLQPRRLEWSSAMPVAGTATHAC
ncbi:MAG: hypothetical protein RIT24_2272 [Planctomycetota bacterium]|jgi:hypothetical protein